MCTQTITTDTKPIQKCPVCGNNIKFNKKHKKYNMFCSKKCQLSDKGKQITNKKRKSTYNNKTELEKNDIKNKRKMTNIEKFGVDNPFKSKELIEDMKEKRELTMKEKYGDEHISKTDHFHDKYKQTSLEKYGVDNPMKSDEVKEKQKATLVEKYGVDNPMKSDEVKEKQKATILKKYGVENVFQSEDVKIKIKDTMLLKYGVEYWNQNDKLVAISIIKSRKKYFNTFISLLKNKNIEPLFDIETYSHLDYLETNNTYKCLRCNNTFESTQLKVQKIYCPNHSKSSIAEFEVSEEILKLNNQINIIKNKKFANDGKLFEIDIYLPEYNLGIEYHGLYWHSELYKDKNYHIDKYNHFKKLGIELIQIFESEWINSKAIVMSLLANRLGVISEKVYGRQCTIKNISNDEYRAFLDINHLQGYTRSKIKLGLFKNDELLQIMSFSKPRFNNKFDWENIRTATKINTIVVGGFSKLLKYFTSNYKGSIISYVDVRYFTGTGYIKNGFMNVGISKPNYFYFIRNILILENRMKYQKHKLETLLNIFDANLTEHENMLNNGYLRIYDAGNLIMVKDA